MTGSDGSIVISVNVASEEARLVVPGKKVEINCTNNIRHAVHGTSVEYRVSVGSQRVHPKLPNIIRYNRESVQIWQELSKTQFLKLQSVKPRGEWRLLVMCARTRSCVCKRYWFSPTCKWLIVCTRICHWRRRLLPHFPPSFDCGIRWPESVFHWERSWSRWCFHRSSTELYRQSKKQVCIHDWTVACDWAGAVMPENHEKSEVISDRPTDMVNYRVAYTRLKTRYG